jgi:CRP-like cAMP-binding protein
LPGDYLGLSELVKGMRRGESCLGKYTRTVVPMDVVVAISFGPTGLAALREKGALDLALAETVARSERAHSLSMLESKYRILETLRELAQRASSEPFPSHEILGKMCGTTRETVTRILPDIDREFGITGRRATLATYLPLVEKYDSQIDI